mmetsp:Transcript_130/g.362  ORF Transcript_130/g.362 Transcript_130/m.362 type:complete len:303 (-) Transcript_130:1594-2502(-)
MSASCSCASTAVSWSVRSGSLPSHRCHSCPASATAAAWWSSTAPRAATRLSWAERLAFLGVNPGGPTAWASWATAAGAAAANWGIGAAWITPHAAPRRTSGSGSAHSATTASINCGHMGTLRCWSFSSSSSAMYIANILSWRFTSGRTLAPMNWSQGSRPPLWTRIVPWVWSRAPTISVKFTCSWCRFSLRPSASAWSSSSPSVPGEVVSQTRCSIEVWSSSPTFLATSCTTAGSSTSAPPRPMHSARACAYAWCIVSSSMDSSRNPTSISFTMVFTAVSTSCFVAPACLAAQAQDTSSCRT